MRLIRTIALLLFLGFAGLAAGSADAATACFDWDCTNAVYPNYQCSFDASCSVGLPYIWKYRWDFGDGTGTGLLGSPTTQHEFGSSTPHFDVTLYIYPQGEDETTVTCAILTHNITGPALPTSGRCSE